MGTRQSTAATPAAGGTQGRGTTSAADSVHLPPGHHHHHHHPHHQASTSSHRAIGTGGSVAAAAPYRGFPVSIPASNGGASASGSGAGAGSPDSDDSTPDDDPLSRAILGSSSLPVHLFSFRDIKCPVCSKMVPPDDVECHFVMCLTRPRINYNEDVLLEDKDECVICFEELHQGDTIARLPCLCIYHKSCIDEWFKVKRSCPEHPND